MKIKEVVILCGGRGARLKPMTNEIPKPLVKVNGRPILDYIIDFYLRKGFSRLSLCLGYKADMIKSYYDTCLLRKKISFFEAGEDASMLERIWQLREHVGERFFVSYGDTLIDLDIERMVESHLKRKASATIVTAKIRNPFGLVNFDSAGWAESFVEKPLLDYFIGSFLLERAALSFITKAMLKKPDGKGLVDFFLHLINNKRMAVFEHDGPQITFNSESERRIAEEAIGRFYTFRERS